MHYHYHTWPDHGVPDYTDPIRVLSRLLRSTKIEGPPIVHCSAGTAADIIFYLQSVEILTPASQTFRSNDKIQHSGTSTDRIGLILF